MTETMNLLFITENDKTTEEKATAVGKIKDVTKLVTPLLNEYDRGGEIKDVTKLVTPLLDEYDRGGKIKDVTKLVSPLLDEYDRGGGKLTWHNTVPEDEIWVNVGGDHGSGSFSTLQIANLDNPNSKLNTRLLLIADCNDSPKNLSRLLNLYKDQIKSQQTMTCRGKKIRLFLYSDYDFLLKLYGISGAQGTHQYTYCTASKAQIQTPP